MTEASDKSASGWPPPHWQQVPEMEVSDEEGFARAVAEQRPAVLREGSIVPASRWEEIEVLLETMRNTEVRVKKSRRQNVAYFRADRNAGGYAFDAKALVEDVKMPFADFVAEANELRARHRDAAAEAAAQQCAGEERPTGASSGSGATGSMSGVERPLQESVLYCQEPLARHTELQGEFVSWNWPWALRQSERHGWGLPETNVLYMGTEGASTPAHFDEQHNFLCQVRGHKLAVLFPPEDTSKLYPFPVTHPCDRCSMVDVRNPDLDRFPSFESARGHSAELGPGDLLYIPCGWWHYCRTQTHLAASVTFWSLASRPGDAATIPETLGPPERARAMRNLEKLLAEDVGPAALEQEVLRLLDVIEGGGEDPRLTALRQLLGVLQVPEEEQLSFLSDTFRGRFGFDPSQYA